MRGAPGFHSNCLVLHGLGVQGVVILAKDGLRTDKALLYLYQRKTKAIDSLRILTVKNVIGRIN
jgi:hypothetical protein